MNKIAILLIIVVILLFYVLYNYFSVRKTNLTSSADLKNQTSVDITDNPGSAHYAYGIWIYVNNWTSETKVIYARNDNIELYLDGGSPILKCKIMLNNNSDKTLEITDNFPLQKWTHIVVSVDGQYVDGYLDGKLLKSGRMIDSTGTNGPKQPSSTSIAMQLGGNNFDAIAARFQHWAEPINPQTVWNEYLDGNGQGGFMGFISSIWK
jgi:hypothetical protein